MILFKKQLFDLEVKGQGPTKVITVAFKYFDFERHLMKVIPEMRRAH
jgi:hypothetical protein